MTMSSKIYVQLRDGWHWHTAMVNGKMYWLRRIARLGDCFRA
jgi:hypothetical protein